MTNRIFDDLKELNENAKKLRDSIFENDIFNNATPKQKETFYRMLSTLIKRTQSYMEEFKDKKHVIETQEFIEKLQKVYPNKDIEFYLNTAQEKLDWYFENEKEEFITACDMVILWPIRLINERMYRNLFGEVHDSRFDKVFKDVEEDSQEN